uniref:Barrier-to-autointegration factor-like protein n=1 Tax=Amblyomma sculptum TaxID=1581419 RepID=A0A1E1XVJ0_AMBSC
MSTTSEKHRNFVSEPMGDKDVTDIAGIDGDLATQMKDKGFDKAYIVVGKFLVIGRNKDEFISWLKDVGGANDEQAEVCFECLDQYCREFC